MAPFRACPGALKARRSTFSQSGCGAASILARRLMQLTGTFLIHRFKIDYAIILYIYACIDPLMSCILVYRPVDAKQACRGHQAAVSLRQEQGWQGARMKRNSMARYGTAWHGREQVGSARLGSAWLGLHTAAHPTTTCKHACLGAHGRCIGKSSTTTTLRLMECAWIRVCMALYMHVWVHTCLQTC